MAFWVDRLSQRFSPERFEMLDIPVSHRLCLALESQIGSEAAGPQDIDVSEISTMLLGRRFWMRRQKRNFTLIGKDATV